MSAGLCVLWLQDISPPYISTLYISTPDFSSLGFSSPDFFQSLTFQPLTFQNSGLKSLELKATIDLCMKRETKVSSGFFLVKSSENYFISLPAFYLIISLMKAIKTFEKIAILKTQGLVSFCDVKTHFGKIPLK